MMASSPTLSPAIRDDDALPTASLDEPPLPPSLAESEPSSTDRYHDTLKRMTQGIEEIGKSMGIIIERLDEDAENDVEKERKRDLLQDGEQFEIHQVIPEVKEFDNWKDFKNQFSENEDRYVIEALVMGSTLLDEQEQEKTNRLRAQLRAQNISNPLKALLKPELQVDSPRAQSFARNGPGNHRSQPFIQQVRLLTPAVIAMLKILSNGKEGWDHSVLNFKPPFRSFVHFHPQMLQELKRLEATARRDSTGRGAEAQIQNQQDPDPSDEFPHGANVPSALKQFRCYVGFVEERILPLALHFQHDESGQEQALKIRYHDLSYLFQPGQLVHVPHTSDSLSSGGQTLWRVYHVLAPGDVDRDRDVPFDPIRGPFDPPRGPYDPPRGSPRVGGFDTDSQKALKFTLKCYYLDFNGQKYGAVCKDFIIGEYRDEKDIKTLPIFPLRYLDQWSTYLEKACSDGKKFLELISNKYGSYSGWTLMSTPSGELRRGRYVNEPAMHPEHIDSDILVDFNEAYNHFPQWNPPFAAVTRQQIATVVEWDAVDYYVWNDPSRLKITSKLREKVVESDGVSHVQYNDFLDKDEFLRAGQGKLSESTEEHLALLPDRMVVYALWERKFVQVDARLVRLTQSSEKNPFDSLEIENTHRQMIQSIVHEHFQLKRIEDIERHGGLISQDIIGNKGKGTVILLHGVPGVGKTATAEAVAQKWHRPLFPITCGDLGMSAREVETSLGEIFRLANLWGCVLLLDEADVFITKRDTKDIFRNSLVSVFLRMMEYYNGILILTTNRPGVLDEAVKSRVHLSLLYKPLDLPQTKAIFRLNINKLKEREQQRAQALGARALFIKEDKIMDFAENQFNNFGKEKGLGRWNGRQIRNAFSIAASLAHFEEVEYGSEFHANLSNEHFEQVNNVTLIYDHYRASVLGKTDPERAAEEQFRADDFDTEVK